MKVSDLIAQLQKFPQDMEVYVPKTGGAGYTCAKKASIASFKLYEYRAVKLVDPAAEAAFGTAVFLR
jgi:hypothetical protein